jgi:hypothetical protein
MHEARATGHAAANPPEIALNSNGLNTLPVKSLNGILYSHKFGKPLIPNGLLNHIE